MSSAPKITLKLARGREASIWGKYYKAKGKNLDTLESSGKYSDVCQFA